MRRIARSTFLTFLFLFGIMSLVRRCDGPIQPTTIQPGQRTERAGMVRIRPGRHGGEDSRVYSERRSGEFRVLVPSIRTQPQWDPESGNLYYRRYGPTLGFGFQATMPKALGLDARIARYEDFGLNVGASYFFDDKKIGETLTIGYNLRKSAVLSNTDIIFGGSYTRRTILVGIRVELGQL